MAQYTAPRRTGMGPGFWPVTIALTIANIAVGIWIVVLPIDTYLPQMGSTAPGIDNLFKFMSVIGNGIFVYVTGYLVYFAWVWRRRPSDPPNAIGIQIHDNPKLEMWWTIVPAAIMVVVAGLSLAIWATLQTQQGDVLTMEAIGHQFNYEFRYPTLKSSVFTEPHIPVNVPITMHVTSADVIHSFWIPEIRVKADMVPGLINTVRFTPMKTGEYRLICTEFCGTNHGKMQELVSVDDPAKFKAWEAQQAKDQGASANSSAGAGGLGLSQGLADAGKTAFGAHCTSCHNAAAGFDGKIVGPGLLHLTDDPAHPNLVTGKKPTPENIADLLVNGYSGPDMSASEQKPAIGAMPNQQANALSTKDVANLTAYLVSLK